MVILNGLMAESYRMRWWSRNMTDWQWRVLIALIRYVLRKNEVDITCMYDNELESEDENILVEAVIRDNQ